MNVSRKHHAGMDWHGGALDGSQESGLSKDGPLLDPYSPSDFKAWILS
jgi:hypothetical protein